MVIAYDRPEWYFQVVGVIGFLFVVCAIVWWFVVARSASSRRCLGRTSSSKTASRVCFCIAGNVRGLQVGNRYAHCLLNETSADVLYLEVGDRTAGDLASYPDDDLLAAFVEGHWRFRHKDGTRY